MDFDGWEIGYIIPGGGERTVGETVREAVEAALAALDAEDWIPRSPAETEYRLAYGPRVRETDRQPGDSVAVIAAFRHVVLKE
jgi:hypothetical protein